MCIVEFFLYIITYILYLKKLYIYIFCYMLECFLVLKSEMEKFDLSRPC